MASETWTCAFVPAIKGFPTHTSAFPAVTIPRKPILARRSHNRPLRMVAQATRKAAEESKSDLVEQLSQYGLAKESEDGSLKSSSVGEPHNSEPNLEVLDEIEAQGVQDLQAIQATIVDELDALRENPNTNLDAMIDKETQKVLASARNHQKALLEVIESDKKVIEKQAETLKGLSRKSFASPSSLRSSFPQLVGIFLAAAGLWYLLDGAFTKNSESISSAAIDLIACFALYAYTSWKRR